MNISIYNVSYLKQYMGTYSKNISEFPKKNIKK